MVEVVDRRAGPRPAAAPDLPRAAGYEVLGQVREACFFEDREALDDLRQSADWQPLRPRADFRQLLAALGISDPA